MKTRNNFIWTLVFLALILAILLSSIYLVSRFLPNASAKYWRQKAEKLQEQLSASQEEANKVPALEKELAASKKEAKETQEVANKVPTLEKELAASKKEATNLKEQLAKKALFKDSYLLSLFFKKAKYPYEMRDKSFKFYSDPSCEEKYLIKEDLIFSGWQDYAIPDLESGETLYSVSYSSSRKSPVFSKPEDGHPSFNAIK